MSNQISSAYLKVYIATPTGHQRRTYDHPNEEVGGSIQDAHIGSQRIFQIWEFEELQVLKDPRVSF